VLLIRCAELRVREWTERGAAIAPPPLCTDLIVASRTPPLLASGEIGEGAGAERYVLHERTRGCVDGQGLLGMQAGEGKCACDVRSNQDPWSGQVTSDDPGLWIR
jgi:hypothetical protein